MGIYSKEGQKTYLESDRILTKAPEDYYKAKMFYGNVQVYIDASNETEAKYFAARAVNDFDTFCKCYAPDNGDKLNGIVVKPVGEMSNEFVACCTTLDGSRSFEHVIIREGKIVETKKNTVVNEGWDDIHEKMKSQNPEAYKKAKEDKGNWDDIHEKMKSQNSDAYEKAKEDKGDWKDIKAKMNKESVNLARDF